MSGQGVDLGPIDDIFNWAYKDVIVKPTKEITGAAAAEEANAMARDQFNETKAESLKAREDATIAKQRGQIAASNAAGSARSSNVSPKVNANKVGDTKDFLGL